MSTDETGRLKIESIAETVGAGAPAGAMKGVYMLVAEALVAEGRA